MLRKMFGALACVLLLAGCDVSGMVPAEQMDFAKRVVRMVQTHDDAGLEAVSHPSLWQHLTPDIRAQMAAMFPNEQPASITVSSWKSSFDNDFSNVSMVMLYKYSTGGVTVTLGFQSAGTRNVLTEIYVRPEGMAAPSQPQPQPQQPQSQPQQQPDQQQDDQQQDDTKSNTL